MKTVIFGLAFLGVAAYGTTLTGSIRNTFDDTAFTSLSTTLTLTDGVQTLSFTSSSTLLPGLGFGGCTLGRGVTGSCTYDPSFTTNLNSLYIFSYFTPGGGAGAVGTVNFNVVGTPITLQQTDGASSHSNLAVTLSGNFDLRLFPGGTVAVGACGSWCNQTFTGTGVSSGSFTYFSPTGGSYNRRVDFTLTGSEVPEPATWMSFGVAVLGLAALRKKIAG